MNNISIVIRAIIEANEITQVEFSKKTTIPLPTVKKYLQGSFNPTFLNIEKINRSFNLEIGLLLEIDLNNNDMLIQAKKYYEEEFEKEYHNFDKSITENTIILIDFIEEKNTVKHKIQTKELESKNFPFAHIEFIEFLRKKDIQITVLENDKIEITVSNSYKETVDYSELLSILDLMSYDLIDNMRKYTTFVKSIAKTVKEI